MVHQNMHGPCFCMDWSVTRSVTTLSESTVHEYQCSIGHFPETSSLMSSGSGTNYDFLYALRAQDIVSWCWRQRYTAVLGRLTYVYRAQLVIYWHMRKGHHYDGKLHYLCKWKGSMGLLHHWDIHAISKYFSSLASVYFLDLVVEYTVGQ